MSSWTHHRVDVGEVTLHVVEAGAGPLVVLLHGFPEYWYSWRLQIDALVAAGFRVVAPDMRGYGESDKPPKVSDYRPARLTADVAGLIDALGETRAHVVGHDWGGGVAWFFAMQHPERLDRLVVLNCPHPERLWKSFGTLKQLRKSWYIAFFQLPWLPELAIRAGNHRAVRRVLRQVHRDGAFTPEDVDRYVQAAAQPGAVRGSINYYRAVMREGPGKLKAALRPISAPTLVVWGDRDPFLGPELAQSRPGAVLDERLVRIPEAGHWVQVDAPERVNALIVEHFG